MGNRVFWPTQIGGNTQALEFGPSLSSEPITKQQWLLQDTMDFSIQILSGLHAKKKIPRATTLEGVRHMTIQRNWPSLAKNLSDGHPRWGFGLDSVVNPGMTPLPMTRFWAWFPRSGWSQFKAHDVLGIRTRPTYDMYLRLYFLFQTQHMLDAPPCQN